MENNLEPVKIGAVLLELINSRYKPLNCSVWEPLENKLMDILKKEEKENEYKK